MGSVNALQKLKKTKQYTSVSDNHYKAVSGKKWKKYQLQVKSYLSLSPSYNFGLLIINTFKGSLQKLFLEKF